MFVCLFIIPKRPVDSCNVKNGRTRNGRKGQNGRDNHPNIYIYIYTYTQIYKVQALRLRRGRHDQRGRPEDGDPQRLQEGHLTICIYIYI